MNNELIRKFYPCYDPPEAARDASWGAVYAVACVVTVWDAVRDATQKAIGEAAQEAVRDKQIDQLLTYF